MFLKNLWFPFLLLFIFAPVVDAQIYINEIYASPTSPNTEWVELYNDSDEPVVIRAYTLKDLSNNSIHIPELVIPAKGFVVGESSNVLNNSGDTVILRDKDNTIIDSVTYNAISTNYTYVRCPDGAANFKQSQIPSRYNTNGISCLVNTPTPTLLPTSTQIPTSTVMPTPSFTITPVPEFKLLYISEVMVQPISGEKEWIELFNDSSTEITLEDWFIDDGKNSGSSPRSFSLVIPAKSYAVYELPTGIFNNDSDTVRLLDSEEHEVETFAYSISSEGKTWGKNVLTNNQFCLQLSSKNAKNNECIIVSPSSNPTKILTNTPKPTGVAVIGKTNTVNTTEIDISSSPVKAIRPSSTPQKKLNTNPESAAKRKLIPSKNDTLGINTYGNVIEYKKEPSQTQSKSILLTAISYASIASGSIFYKLKQSISIPFYDMY